MTPTGACDLGAGPSWPALLLFLMLACLSAQPSRAQPADTIVVNGLIETLDEASRVVDALAIRGDRIVGVGSDDEMRAVSGPATRVIDALGRRIIPGLIDSHIHAIRAGLTFATEVSWIGVTSLAEALTRLSEAARAKPSGEWIVVAGGWNVQQFAERRRPSQKEIESAAPDHPVYIQMSYISALLSRSGYERLGIAEDADIPSNGHFERDPSGRRTGWINGDIGVFVALYGKLPKPAPAQAVEGTRAFLQELTRYGLTGVSDPQGHNIGLEDYTALFALHRDGGLPLRVRYSLCAPRPGREEEDLPALLGARPMGSGDDWLRFEGFGECVTWGMYNVDRPDAQAKAQLERVAGWAAQAGVRLTFHWNSDASVHHLLDLLELVNARHPLAPLRWSIAHVHDATPATLRRMRDLGLGWLVQDRLFFAAPSFLNAYAQSRLAIMPPVISALRMGLPVGFGTDANRVMSYNPFVALQWLLDGRTIDGRMTRSAAEIPSRSEALRMYTQGSAWFTGEDDRRGRIAPGYLADVALLSGDVMRVPVAEIGSIVSDLTIVGGRIVHAVGDFKGLARRD